MVKVLTIGAATQDIIIEYQEGLDVSIISNGVPHLAFQEGSKIEVQELHYATGGGATNSAVSFQQLGIQTTACFKVGDDAAGKALIEDLETYGIALYAHFSKKVQTGVSFIIPSSKKDRIIFTYRGANKTMTTSDIPESKLHEFDCIYITSLTEKAADCLPHLVHAAQKNITGTKLKVAVNPGTSQLSLNVNPLKAALRSIDILIMNSQEMKLFMTVLKPRFFKSTGNGIHPQGPALLQKILAHETITFTLQDYFQEIISYGVKRVVVTDGKNGVYVATKDTIFYHPALPVEVINSLGAGDAFGSCFVASLLKGKKIENAIRYGVINAASVIMQHDAKSGLLTQLELNNFLEDFDNSLLQTFPLQKKNF
jgi:sugar/nucleoside kinase (ribokinase family)